MLTNEVEPPKIPVGTYDTGNGYFDPETKSIKDYVSGEDVGYPTGLEIEWIQNQCRMGISEEADSK